LVLVGGGAPEVAAALAALYPAIFALAEAEAAEALPEPAAVDGEGEAPAAPAEEQEASKEEDTKDSSGEGHAEGGEGAGQGEGEEATPAGPEKEAYPGAKACARLLASGLCPVLCLDAAGVVAFKAAATAAVDAAAEGAEGKGSSPIPAPATFVCFGAPPSPPALPATEEEPEPAAPEPLSFDATLPASESPVTTLEALKGVAAIKARLPAAAHVDTSVCTAVLHDYDWSKAGTAPQRTVLRLNTNTTECVTVSLPRGRHVLQLDVDPGFYFTANVRSMTAFDMGAPAKLLEEKQLAAPEMAAGDWCVWFRRVFKCTEATMVSAALEVSDAGMSPFARFAVVDNDGTANTTHFVAGAAPPKVGGCTSLIQLHP
jgi:hypothetical protein